MAKTTIPDLTLLAYAALEAIRKDEAEKAKAQEAQPQDVEVKT